MASDWGEFDPDPSDTRTVIIGEYELRRCDIPKYMHDPEIVAMYEIYNRYKRYGWSTGGGWATVPAHEFDIVDTLTREIEAIHGERQSRS